MSDPRVYVYQLDHSLNLTCCKSNKYNINIEKADHFGSLFMTFKSFFGSLDFDPSSLLSMPRIAAENDRSGN